MIQTIGVRLCTESDRPEGHSWKTDMLAANPIRLDQLASYNESYLNNGLE